MTLAFSLDRTVTIRARRATVFRFFTDSARFARWWGAGSTIDPHVGGAVRIRYPDGTTASGAIEELVADERIVFTYGYDAPDASIPPGGSRVTITLHDVAGGTRVELRHDVADVTARDQHVPGWKHALARFADAVANDALGTATEAVAAWFAAWNAEDDTRALALLAPAVAADVSFRDANANVAGLDELIAHLAMVRRFMPGLALVPRGALRFAHGTALSDWAVAKADGTHVMTGTNVVRLDADARIVEVVGVPG